jgi:hypothetical protein
MSRELSLHTGEVVGSIPTAPTIEAHVSRPLLFAGSTFHTIQDGTKREDDASSRGESVEFVLAWFRAIHCAPGGSQKIWYNPMDQNLGTGS